MTETPRDRYLRRTYGITEHQYDEMLRWQGGGCAGCGAKPQPGKRALHVDHDHKTGRVRGILCWRCNQILAKARDDHEILTALAFYLVDPPAQVIGEPIAPHPKKRRRKRKKR